MRKIPIRFFTWLMGLVSAGTLYAWSVAYVPNLNIYLATFFLVCVLYVDCVFLIDGIRQDKYNREHDFMKYARPVPKKETSGNAKRRIN